MLKSIVISLFFISFWCYGHDPNTVSYTLTPTEETTEIVASFPWTIRNALIDFRPQLKEAKTKLDFEKAFFDYTKQHLVLVNIEGEKMKLLKIKPIENQTHTHGNDFKLIYEGTQVKKITNTLLFNTQHEHRNIHFVNNERLVTTKNNPDIYLKTDTKTTSFLWLLCIPFGIVFFLIVKYQI